MNQKQEIVNLFKLMQTKDDLVALLNYVRPMVYPDSKFKFTIRQLIHYSKFNKNLSTAVINNKPDSSTSLLIEKTQGKTQKGRYKTFEIKKKSGKTRIIHAPSNGLKAIQKCLNFIFQVIHTPHAAAMGFVPGKCIVDNAIIHKSQHYVLNVDLKDFFPSIDQARVRGRLLVAPFNLGNCEERTKLASILAILCCTSLETERWNEETGLWDTKTLNVLPQGAPTSPTISNIICERLDIKLTGLAKRYGCKYSRYADDITFSSMHNVYQKEGDFLKQLYRIIKDQNFNIQEKKTRLQKQGYRQEVTGLIVNQSINVNRHYLKTIRQWLYYWEQYGYEKASGIFQLKYQIDKGHSKKGKPGFDNVLWGKLEYLKMVKGAKNPTYTALMDRYIAVLGRPIEDILEIWQTKGIDKAMSMYYNEIGKNNKPVADVRSSKTLLRKIEILKSKGINITNFKIVKSQLNLISDQGFVCQTYMIGKKYLNDYTPLPNIDNPEIVNNWLIWENGLGGKNWLYYQYWDKSDFEDTI